MYSLLDASGNDGDRGALTAAFAELLVREGNPHEYITLLDRLVDDSDRLFECKPADNTLSLFAQLTRTLDTPPASSNGEATPINGSMNSQRARSINTGSLSSNASSLRKRFGFGTLSRENSRNETESRVGSVWRTLSKNTKVTSDGDSRPGSMSKASLMRSKSTDTDARVTAPRRPVSRDRPTIQSAFSSEDQMFRPGSGHNNISNLSTIGEAPIGAVSPRKKRRSSLSDLKSAQDRSVAPSWAPLQPRKPVNVQQPVQRPGSSPRTPSPTKTLAGGSPNRFGSPSRKEKSPLMSRNTLTERAVNRRSDEVVITTYSPKKRNNSQSGIPMLKGGLRERPSPVNGAESPKKASSSPQKLKMQSPQKVSRRLSYPIRRLIE